MTSEPLHEKYWTEIARLDGEHRDLERLWTQVPRLTLFALLSPVLGFMFGWGAALVDLLVTGALVGTAAYLVAVRKSENRWTRDKLVEDVRAHEAEPASQVRPIATRSAA